jgi:hypothetical protein
MWGGRQEPRVTTQRGGVVRAQKAQSSFDTRLDGTSSSSDSVSCGSPAFDPSVTEDSRSIKSSYAAKSRRPNREESSSTVMGHPMVPAPQHVCYPNIGNGPIQPY